MPNKKSFFSSLHFSLLPRLDASQAEEACGLHIESVASSLEPGDGHNGGTRLPYCSHHFRHQASWYLQQLLEGLLFFLIISLYNTAPGKCC